ESPPQSTDSRANTLFARNVLKRKAEIINEKPPGRRDASAAFSVLQLNTRPLSVIRPGKSLEQGAETSERSDCSCSTEQISPNASRRFRLTARSIRRGRGHRNRQRCRGARPHPFWDQLGAARRGSFV